MLGHGFTSDSAQCLPMLRLLAAWGILDRRLIAAKLAVYRVIHVKKRYLCKREWIEKGQQTEQATRLHSGFSFLRPLRDGTRRGCFAQPVTNKT